MRIIGGFLGGRRLSPPLDKWPTRPTTDMAREALYNVLDHRMAFAEISAIDLFGGTGAHSFELISRGCTSVSYVDRYLPCVRWVEAQADVWGVSKYLDINLSDVVRHLHTCTDKYDLIIADPPYDWKKMKELPDLIFSKDILRPSGILIIEHSNKTDFTSHVRCDEVRTYGQTIFSFFSPL